MFAKLLKHDLKSQTTLQLSLGAAALGVSLVAGLLIAMFSWLDHSGINEAVEALLMITGGFALVGMIFGLIAYAYGAFFLPFARFYKNKFTDEGYLTFTLPVTTHQILLSSALAIFLWQLFAGVVLACCGVILFTAIVLVGGKDVMEFLEGLGWVFSQVIRALLVDPDSILTWVLTGLNLLTGWVKGIVVVMLAFTLGTMLAKKHRVLMSILFFFIINFALGSVESIFTGIIYAAAAFQETENIQLIFNIQSAIQTVFSLGAAVGCYFLMANLLKKRLNLL